MPIRSETLHTASCSGCKNTERAPGPNTLPGEWVQAKLYCPELGIQDLDKDTEYGTPVIVLDFCPECAVSWLRTNRLIAIGREEATRIEFELEKRVR